MGDDQEYRASQDSLINGGENEEEESHESPANSYETTMAVLLEAAEQSDPEFSEQEEKRRRYSRPAGDHVQMGTRADPLYDPIDEAEAEEDGVGKINHLLIVP